MRKTSLSIVHLFTHSEVTRGGAVQGLLLARDFQKRGHQVVSFFHTPFHSSKQKIPKFFQPFQDFPLDIRRINMKNPVDYFRFFRLLQREQVDIIHAHRNLALLFGYFSTMTLSPRPVLLVNRGTTYSLPNLLVKQVFLSHRLNHIIAVAQAVKEKLIQEGVDSQKISVVYGSYDEKRFHPKQDGTAIRKEFDSSPSSPLIVCIAAIDPRKGLEFLVQAMNILVKKFPTAKLLLVGNTEDFLYHRFIENEIKRFGLEERIILTGHRTDIPEILAASDVSVNASIEGEGFTGALRESLATQKPVVCTAVCGNPELIRNGETGWLVPPKDPLALAQALREALTDREEAMRRALNGHRLITRLGNTATRCQRIEEIYYSLLRNPS